MYIRTSDGSETFTFEPANDRQQLSDMLRVYGCRCEEGRFPNFFRDPFGRGDFAPKELRKHMPRLFVALLVYYGGLYVNNLGQAWLQRSFANYYEARWAPVPPFGVEASADNGSAKLLVSHWRNATVVWHWPASARPSEAADAPHQDEMVTLWDVTFTYLPYVNSSVPADVFAGGSAIVSLVRFVIIPGPLSLRWTFLARALVIWGLLFLCRAVTITTTPLPNPYHKCVPRVHFPQSIWLEAWANLPILGAGYNELTCQDVMFSGHTVMGTLFTLFLVKYMALAPWSRHTADTSLRFCSLPMFIDLMAFIWCLWGWFHIAASHFHYTVDVLVGIMMTVLVFVTYHYVAKIVWLRRRHPMHISLSPCLRWFELHAKDIRLWRVQALRNLEGRQREVPFVSSGSLDDSSSSCDDEEARNFFPVSQAET
eukprot:TRINITY_DN45909_c0_g1_i1.p1 TRINITY_DN45909_c0_g1~~TRINITY_DN45909_c0_g1_i1.p1  ORF type:complete len:426 (+),score=67.27 TRINITY_DN45909_c0_g1_i1:278-1555(+)